MSNAKKDDNNSNTKSNSNENGVNLTEKKQENNNANNKENIDLKDLPSYEYFQKTVQKEIQQGLMNVSKLKPSNPIKFLGEYLLEKSKSYKP